MGWVCCWSGELSGEPLESDERSEPECMDCSWAGQTEVKVKRMYARRRRS